MMSVRQSSYQPGTQFVLLPQTMIGSTVPLLPQATVAGVPQQGVIQQTGSTTRQVMPQAAGGATGFTSQQPNDPNKQGKLTTVIKSMNSDCKAMQAGQVCHS